MQDKREKKPTKKQGQQRVKSLNKRLLLFLILCWVVPIAVFYTFTTFSYRNSIIEKAEGLMEDELKSISMFVNIRIEDAISYCQRPSYEKNWEKGWEKYQMGEMGKTAYVQEIFNSLKYKFYSDVRFNTYAFYIYEEEDPNCYSSRIGRTYQDYVTEIQPRLQEIFSTDSLYPFVKVIEGRLFVIRNLYTTSGHERFGNFVVELNVDRIFQDIRQNTLENMFICIDDTSEFLELTDGDEQQKKKLTDAMVKGYDRASRGSVTRENDKIYNAYLYQQKYDNYHMGVALLAERSEIYASLYDLYKIVILMLILFVPLILYSVYFLEKEIREPISRLVNASRRIEEGKIGTVVEGDEMPNAEFNFLMDSFNSMSSQVKYLFEYVYDEKLARKDAQIQALQAQINPHFLNNTLEMMNWQARMNGDTVVSKMIEALATVLDYRMNRASVKVIHLSEELQCTDAYLYIMTMRFGQRLQIEKEIDEDMFSLYVPPLILQPIVENAVVHGVESVKNGIIKLKVFHDGTNAYISVSNTGKALSEEDMQRIQAILAGDESRIPKVKGRHTSIGIRNVNQRLKLVYGEEYGLAIEQADGENIISTITIPYREQGERDGETERGKVESELMELQKGKKTGPKEP